MTPATAASEPSDCVWCGRPLAPEAERLAGRRRCSDCGAATTDPWPTAAQLASAYERYRPEGGARFALGGDLILRSTRGLLARRVDRIAPPGPVLDVGAGDGTLLDALAGRGRRALGLERESSRDDVSDASLSEIGRGDPSGWAAVIFWHSLEHLPDPGDAVAQAWRLLEPGGVLIVAVPDNDSLQAKLFGDRWLHLDLPRHLAHLTRASLEQGLAQAGFTIRRRSSTRGGQIVIGWLDGLVGLLPGHPSLYQALRGKAAQIEPQSAFKRAIALLAAVALLPVALLGSASEVIMRRSGTIYLEATRG